MDAYSREEIEAALQVIASVIQRCEKTQPKFAQGSPQHTLLKNRIQSMRISKALITGQYPSGKYSRDELIEALRPVASILQKCEKARQKHPEGTPLHTRLTNIIKAMHIAKAWITDEID